MTCSCPDRRDLGLLLLRVGTGGVLAAHGTQKLFGWFGGGGLQGTGAWMESIGYVPGKMNALVAGVAEAGGGTLLALGLATPAAGSAAAGAMAGASAVHAPNGFFSQGGGYEYPAFLGMVSAALAVTGPGRYSADHALGHSLNRAWMVPAGLAGAAVGVLVTLGARRRARRSPEA
ncbi:RpiR family transcriptional regulator [Streptomyces sp. WAC 01529]|uniref:DoxX family protein n=1 Tax=Streptomyces sp. WAC 01529 TaxID=2203205 RepID=UPI000F700CEE|nr:DoxX family membrane protein [Streptomyces sp. WAC 01529]AZM52951.1 RpiR family transcriptional regulator [Streptomyces sp. WAC 01529]